MHSDRLRLHGILECGEVFQSWSSSCFCPWICSGRFSYSRLCDSKLFQQLSQLPPLTLHAVVVVIRRRTSDREVLNLNGESCDFGLRKR